MTRNSQDDFLSQKSTGDAKPPLPAWSPQAIESGLEVAPASEHDKQYVNPVHHGDKEVVSQAEKEVIAPCDLKALWCLHQTNPLCDSIASCAAYGVVSSGYC